MSHEYDEVTGNDSKLTAKKLSAVGGFVGTVLGSRRGKLGAIVGGVLGGTLGYVAGNALDSSDADTPPIATDEEPVVVTVADDETEAETADAAGEHDEAQDEDEAADAESDDATEE